MVINGWWDDTRITLSLKNNSFTIGIDEMKDSRVFSFDLQGRLWAAMQNGIAYRRGLDGKIIARWANCLNRYDRRWLTVEESELFITDINQTVTQLSSAIRTGNIITTLPNLPGEVVNMAKKAALFTSEAAHKDEADFQQAYKPIGILPPDQYMSVVLQMTEGCSYNSCTFCSFYRGRPFHIKSLDEFAAHIQAVKSYLGEGLNLRRTIFLGDANSLVIPLRMLIPRLEMVNSLLPVEELGGIYAFLDGFSADRKSVTDYHAIANLGVKRIYVGLESGCEALLKYLEKPGCPADVLNAVKTIKSGGISVGIIVLLGAGGHLYDHSHVQNTVNIINLMNLDMDDLIYFSELVSEENIPYVKKAFDADCKPLTLQEMEIQMNSIESGFRFSSSGGTPHISRYDIREFVY